MFNPLTILPNDASANTNDDNGHGEKREKQTRRNSPHHNNSHDNLLTSSLQQNSQPNIANNVFQRQHSTDDLEILLTNQNQPNQCQFQHLSQIYKTGMTISQLVQSTSLRQDRARLIQNIKTDTA
jgi:hypothetical protein